MSAPAVSVGIDGTTCQRQALASRLSSESPVRATGRDDKDDDVFAKEATVIDTSMFDRKCSPMCESPRMLHHSGR